MLCNSRYRPARGLGAPPQALRTEEQRPHKPLCPCRDRRDPLVIRRVAVEDRRDECPGRGLELAIKMLQEPDDQGDEFLILMRGSDPGGNFPTAPAPDGR